MGHIIDRGHSISAGASALSKLNARCRLYDPSRTVVHYVIQVCTCQKRSPRFQTNMRVTKSIAMCLIEMKRCRFGVQNGVFTIGSTMGCRSAIGLPFEPRTARTQWGRYLSRAVVPERMGASLQSFGERGGIHLFARRIGTFSFDFGISQLISSPFHWV